MGDFRREPTEVAFLLDEDVKALKSIFPKKRVKTLAQVRLKPDALDADIVLKAWNRGLTKLLVERKMETLRKGWQEMPKWVFCSETGTPLHKSDFERRVFHKMLSKAGLRHIRFHDLRHSFASRLIQNGESLAYVKEQMGHHSIQITVDIYGHLVPGANRAAVNRLDEQPQNATIRNPAATVADHRTGSTLATA